jgi:hypothetical protein
MGSSYRPATTLQLVVNGRLGERGQMLTFRSYALFRQSYTPRRHCREVIRRLDPVAHRATPWGGLETPLIFQISPPSVTTCAPQKERTSTP